MRPLATFIVVLGTLMAGVAAAFPPVTSLIPTPRPDRGAGAVVTDTADAAISALAVAQSARPAIRGTPPNGFADRAERMALERMGRTSDPGFAVWIQGFFERAEAQGIRRDTLERAFTGVQLDDRIIELDQNQAEFSRTLWDYLDRAVSDARIRNGRAARDEHVDILRQIEARYGVEAEVVVAVWGLESAYGTSRGSTDIIEAMATLAYEGRRQDFFETQLIAALRIIQSGDVRADHMTGSWAGAMGHTQFMPTSYLEHAVDFNGDGRRDIWSDNPVDALASTAAYLAHFGWTTGQPWGVEVRLPDGFDYTLTGERVSHGAAFWQTRGVRLADGGPLPDHGDASIVLPAGAQGVALMIFDNFRVIERYNPADAYVIAIGHLSDRIIGGPAFRGGWPRDDRALTGDERRELQERLNDAGFPTSGVDGIIGPNTIEAVRQYQQSIGVVPDGYASLRILERLR
jgi:lytic murein transglycosylase